MFRGRALLAILVAIAGCSDHDLELGEPPSSVPQQGQLVKPDEVNALDAFVRDINGFDSAEAFKAHGDRFSDDIDGHFADVYCPFTNAVESSLREVTRSWKSQVLRKLVLTWKSTEEHTSTTTHEAYHYDEARVLRVVVVDREVDHSNDEAFRKEVETHNAEIARTISQLPNTSEGERVAIAQKGHELRDPITITQYRVYYRTDGTAFYETRRDGLEAAQASDYPDIEQSPPTLYGASHPANVTALPFLLALSPRPRYAARPLPEVAVTSREQSIQRELIAGSLANGEFSLLSKPVCR